MIRRAVHRLAQTLLLLGGMVGADAVLSPGQAEVLPLGSGDIAGASYLQAGALCRVINMATLTTGPHCLVDPVGSGRAAIAGLRSGQLSLALMQSKLLADAVAGRGSFAKDGAFTDLRALFSLRDEALAVVTTPAAGVKTVTDLKGKRVNLGRPGSYQRMMGDALLKSAGLSVTDLAAATELDFPEQVKALCDNRLDVGLFSGLHPLADVQDVLEECGGTLVPVAAAAQERLLRADPAFVATSLREGLYQGQRGDVASVGVSLVLVTTKSLPQETAHQLVKAVLSQLPALRTLHPLLDSLDPAVMLRQARVIPLYDGIEQDFPAGKATP